METIVDQQLPAFEKRGNKIRANFGEETFQSEEGKTFWKYLTAEFSCTASRGERIESIISIKYPTYGSELAAINNGGEEATAYLDFRTKAKQIATDSFSA